MPTQYSGIPVNLVKEVDEFSGLLLKKRADLQIIFEESLGKGKEKQLEELAFTSKYVKGLFRVLKDGSRNSEIKNIDNIKTDLTENMKKVVSQLKEILSEADINTLNYFNCTYFDLSSQCYINLNELLEDLEWTKKYLNSLKRGIRN